MTELERGLGQRWFEQVWNQGRREAIAELLTPSAVVHESGVDTLGPDGFYAFFDRMNATFSDLHVTVQDSIAEGDKLCVRWSCEARHTGAGLGLAPTGLTIHVTGISILRVAGGRIVEGWQNWDMLGMMEQINAVGRLATYMSA